MATRKNKNPVTPNPKPKKPCKDSCTNLCVNCEHYIPKQQYTSMIYGYDESCSRILRYEKSCVDGTESPVYNKLSANKNGKCRYWKAKPFARLLNELEHFTKYDHQGSMDCFGRLRIAGVLAADLLKVLQGGSSSYFQYIETDDSPYGVHVVISKSAIEEYLRNYELHLEESEEPFYGGAYIDKKSPQEIKKGISWIQTVRKLLREKEESK